MKFFGKNFHLVGNNKSCNKVFICYAKSFLNSFHSIGVHIKRRIELNTRGMPRQVRSKSDKQLNWLSNKNFRLIKFLQPRRIEIALSGWIESLMQRNFHMTQLQTSSESCQNKNIIKYWFFAAYISGRPLKSKETQVYDTKTLFAELTMGFCCVAASNDTIVKHFSSFIAPNHVSAIICKH